MLGGWRRSLGVPILNKQRTRYMPVSEIAPLRVLDGSALPRAAEEKEAEEEAKNARGPAAASAPVVAVALAARRRAPAAAPPPPLLPIDAAAACAAAHAPSPRVRVPNIIGPQRAAAAGRATDDDVEARRTRGVVVGVVLAVVAVVARPARSRRAIEAAAAPPDRQVMFASSIG